LILVRSGRRPIATDLRVALWYLEQNGITMAIKDVTDDAPPQPLIVPRPWWWCRLFERLLQWVGLRRGTAGFGYVIPEPTHG
jgi:hypothetical protein